MKRLLEDIPSIPEIPLIAHLGNGITTRVMAQRQARERERQNSLPNSYDGAQSRRRSSRFLEGASIPNSIIRFEMQQEDPEAKDAATRRKERDEFVHQLMIRLQQSQKNMFRSLYDEDGDREALNRIKKELQKKSLQLPAARRRDSDKDKKNTSLASDSMNEVNTDSWKELKEKQRISRRTSVLAPLGGERRSTYESIKAAIQNSKAMQQLLNADNIEQQKVKEVQTGKSLVPLVVPEQEAKHDLNSNLIGKKDGLRRDKKGTRRASSLKSEKSANLPSDKIFPKKKGIADFRKHSK